MRECKKKPRNLHHHQHSSKIQNIFISANTVCSKWKSLNIVIVRRDNGNRNGFGVCGKKENCGIFYFRFFSFLHSIWLSWAEKDSLIPIVWRVFMLELHIQIKMLSMMVLMTMPLLLLCLPILAPHCHASHLKCGQCKQFHLPLPVRFPSLIQNAYTFARSRTFSRTMTMKRRAKKFILIINANKTWRLNGIGINWQKLKFYILLNWRFQQWQPLVLCCNWHSGQFWRSFNPSQQQFLGRISFLHINKMKRNKFILINKMLWNCALFSCCAKPMQMADHIDALMNHIHHIVHCSPWPLIWSSWLYTANRTNELFECLI